MSTLAAKVMEPVVSAIGAYFVNNVLYVSLSDGREISVPVEKISWLHWLAKATPAQQKNWTLEPNGFAIYWEELDDGIEISHLLGMKALV